MPTLSGPSACRPSGIHTSGFCFLHARAFLHRAVARDVVGRRRMAGLRDHPPATGPGVRRLAQFCGIRLVSVCRARRRFIRSPTPADVVLRRLRSLLGAAPADQLAGPHSVI